MTVQGIAFNHCPTISSDDTLTFALSRMMGEAWPPYISLLTIKP